MCVNGVENNVCIDNSILTVKNANRIMSISISLSLIYSLLVASIIISSIILARRCKEQNDPKI